MGDVCGGYFGVERSIVIGGGGGVCFNYCVDICWEEGVGVYGVYVVIGDIFFDGVNEIVGGGDDWDGVVLYGVELD